MKKIDSVYNIQDVADSFSKAADEYDKYAYFQRNIVARLIARLALMKNNPKRILDLGAGTGNAHESLLERYPDAEIVSVDLAHHMLEKFRQHAKFSENAICADSHKIPLKDNCVDMIFSSLMLQWCNDLNLVFAELQRILKPEGLLIFSTLGPDTMRELREAWSQVDEEVHVHNYIDMHDIGDVMLTQGLVDPVMDMEKVTIEYPEVITIMRDIKHIGAHNMHGKRRKTLTGKTKLKKLIAAYEKFRNESGKYPLTYEVVYGHAWGSDKQPNLHQDGEVHIPLASLRNKE